MTASCTEPFNLILLFLYQQERITELKIIEPAFCYKIPGVSCFVNATQLTGSDIDYVFSVTGIETFLSTTPGYDFTDMPIGKHIHFLSLIHI